MAEGGEGVAVAAVAAAVELEILVGCPPPQGGVAGTLAGSSSNSNNTSSSNNTISLAQVEVAAVAGVRVGRTGSTDGRVAAVP